MMKGMFKVAKSSAEMLARYKVHINRLVPVCTTNFHLSFMIDTIMVGGSLPPRHETTICRPR